MYSRFKAIAAMLCLFAGAAFSQTITGSVTGTVTDATGAAVAGVKVVTTNVGTNITNTTETNSAGVYSFPFLSVGDYNVTAENQGFKKVALGPFKLEVNQTARLDIKLEVGDVTQSVEVSAVAPILQTESTATGDTLSSNKLTSLPLNGRNFASLTLLVPGAISTNPNAMNTSERFQGSGSRPQVNGNREQTNNFLLDGVDVNDSIDNRIGYQPNVDALEEVRVVTGNAGGDFGNVGGASVVMSLKSGTNDFHGNLFEFLRNDKLDANSFFNNRSNIRRGAFRRNIFGGTFGGPIVRNKVFFFTDYEGTQQRTSGPANASVVPLAWRTGNLSQFTQIIRDPLTQQPFPGNIIPQSRIVNPVALKLFSDPSLYPLPNNTGVGPLGITNNYAAASRAQVVNHQADVKIDARPSDKDSLFGRWSIGRYEQSGSQAALPTTLTSANSGPTMSAVVGWTRTYTTRLVNDTRISYSRVGIDENLPVDWSGLLGANGNQAFGIGGGQPYAGLSAVVLGNGLTGIGVAGTVGLTVDNKYQLQTNFTYQVGAHLLKFGGQLLRLQQNRYYAGNNGALGTFTYDGSFTGVAFSDFLLNTLYSKGRGSVSGKWGHRHWRNAAFFQDDWKAARNLTLNLGMRWEFISPLYEVADRQVNINTFTGQLVYPSEDGEFGRATYKPYWKNFMPNIGFAWTPDLFRNKMVVRAGYRFSTFLEGTGANLRLPLNPPFFVESNVIYDPSRPGDIRTGFSDVVAAGDLTSPKTGTNPFYQARAWDLNLRPQFTNQFNFALETQLSSSTSITTAYVGQRGTHLVVPHEANQPLPGVGDPRTWAPLNDRRPLARVLPNVGNIALTESSGTMWYNSLQVSARQRLMGGLEFLASYTLSKSNTDNLGYYGCGSTNNEGAYWQNAYDRRANYGPSCFDARHNFTVGGLFEVPLGRNKAFGSGMPRALDLLVGGWNINYGVSTHSGFPVTIQASSHTANTLQMVRGTSRANYYRPLQVTGAQTIDRFYGDVTFCATGVDNGTCAYGVPSLGQFGSAGVGTERAPSYFNLDSSIGKKFYITESKYFDFRAEFFNTLNHVSWGPPNRDINSGAFGQITGQVGMPRNIQFGLKFYF